MLRRRNHGPCLRHVEAFLLTRLVCVRMCTQPNFHESSDRSRAVLESFRVMYLSWQSLVVRWIPGYPHDALTDIDGQESLSMPRLRHMRADRIIHSSNWFRIVQAQSKLDLRIGRKCTVLADGVETATYSKWYSSCGGYWAGWHTKAFRRPL